MKLQKRRSKQINDKDYFSYIITLPLIHIKKLGWESGDDLQIYVKDDKLIIKKNG